MSFTLLKTVITKGFEVLPLTSSCLLLNTLVNGSQLLLPKFSAADFGSAKTLQTLQKDPKTLPKAKVESSVDLKTESSVDKKAKTPKKTDQAKDQEVYDEIPRWEAHNPCLREQYNSLTDQEFDEEPRPARKSSQDDQGIPFAHWGGVRRLHGQYKKAGCQGRKKETEEGSPRHRRRENQPRSLQKLTDQEFNAFMKNLGQPENMVPIPQKMSKEYPSLTLEEYKGFMANIRRFDERDEKET